MFQLDLIHQLVEWMLAQMLEQEQAVVLVVQVVQVGMVDQVDKVVHRREVAEINT